MIWPTLGVESATYRLVKWSSLRDRLKATRGVLYDSIAPLGAMPFEVHLEGG